MEKRGCRDLNRDVMAVQRLMLEMSRRLDDDKDDMASILYDLILGIVSLIGWLFFVAVLWRLLTRS